MCRIPLTLCAVYLAFAFHNLPSEMTFFRALEHKRRTKENRAREKTFRRCHRRSRLIYRLPSTFHNSHKTIYTHSRSEFLSFFYTFDRCCFCVSRIVVLHSYIYACFAVSCLSRSFPCPQMSKAINFDNGFFLLFAHFICATLFVCTQIKVGPLKGFMHIVFFTLYYECMCVGR